MADFKLPTFTEGSEPEPQTNNFSQRLQGLRPSSSPRVVQFKESDAEAARHGFVSREATVRVARRKKVKEPTRTLGVRVPFRDYDRFMALADKLRLGYQETMIKLLDLGEAQL
jgi:ATP-dependent helicase YprA (DUF1998 family)